MRLLRATTCARLLVECVWEGRLGAGEGGIHLRKSDVLPHNRLALPRSAASVHGVGNEGDSYVAGIARVCTHQRASSGSKALQNERGPKLAALAQAGERDAAMADGRPHGHQCITYELAFKYF